MSASSYLAGAAIDLGVPARVFSVAMGLAMLVPAAAWAMALAATNRAPRSQQSA
jgi:L-asparagine transporter-like permease